MRSASKYAANGVSNEIVICTGGSSRCRWIQRAIKPINRPRAVPPSATTTKRTVAWPNENVPVISATTAN